MDFSFPPHIHHILMHDQLILLDEKSDSYTILSEDQTKTLLTKNEPCTHYTEVRDQLLSLNMIIRQQASTQKINRANEKYDGVDNYTWRINKDKNLRHYKLSAIARACTDLTLLKFNLARHGLGFTLNNMRALKNNCTLKNSYNPQYTYEDYVNGIHLASLVLPFKVKCLESSICIFNHVIKGGQTCDFFIGVQLFDFLSHAWVEIDGKVIADDSDLSKKLPKILSV